MGVSQSRFARIENDPSSVSFDQLLHLLHVLGTEVVLETDDRRFRKGTAAPPNDGDPSSGSGSALDEPW